MEDSQDTEGLKLILDRLGYRVEEKHVIEKVLQDVDSREQDINEVVDLILRTAISNQSFGSDAAKLCDTLIAAGNKSAENSRFRTLLLTKLQEQYRDNLKVRDIDSLPGAKLVAFVMFLGSIFCHVRIKGHPMRALVAPLLESLSKLASFKTESVGSTSQEVVQCITMQLQMHGRELEMLNEIGMAELFCNIRELLLSADVTQFSRLMLLEIIEFRANGWTLSSSANYYYYNIDNT